MGSGRIEIEPDWIEWLLDSIGLSKKNANIRLYIRKNKEKQNLIEQIINCNKERSTFFNILLYFRIYKQENFIFNDKNINIIFKKIIINIRSSRLKPVPTLLVGA